MMLVYRSMTSRENTPREPLSRHSFSGILHFSICVARKHSPWKKEEGDRIYLPRFLLPDGSQWSNFSPQGENILVRLAVPSNPLSDLGTLACGCSVPEMVTRTRNSKCAGGQSRLSEHLKAYYDVALGLERGARVEFKELS